MSRTFTPQEITDILVTEFAAPLIITSIGWIIYGINLCQFFNYVTVLAKKDHLLTKVWVMLVMIMTSASAVYNVYFDWSYSISGFTAGMTAQLSYVNGNVVALYAVVVVLVQFFWLGCVNRLLASKPKLSWALTIPIGILSFSSFVLGVAVAVLSRVEPQGGDWPTPLISIILRTVLALDLFVDLAILAVIITQLTLLRRGSFHFKRTVSKLSYIFCGVTTLSTLVMIAEVIINAPATTKSYVNITITFAPLIPQIYTTGILSILNARTDLWLTRRKVPATQDDGKALIPGLNFTVELPTTTKEIPLTNASEINPEEVDSIAGSEGEKNQEVA